MPKKIKEKIFKPKTLKDKWIWNWVLKEMPRLKSKQKSKDCWIKFKLGKKRFKIIRLE